MKILDIHLMNLNSLRGEWDINLNDSAYKSDGIFAVTGPTGAGKTTIFDAVCLALYGRTPRLSSNPKSEIAEIMSKHTRMCMAKVTFEAGGKNYVCKWSLKRKKEENGEDKLETDHTIKEEGLPEQKGASGRVAEITGLDFRRFTQAMLLAQGEFDAFLSGNPAERAKILELVTGTEIYSEISTRIALRTAKVKAELDKIRTERDALTPRDGLGSDEEISQEIMEIREKLSGLEAERSELEKARTWLIGLRDIRYEISQTDSKIGKLERIIEAFARQRARLEAAIRAKSILHEYSPLTTFRSQYEDRKLQLEKLSQQIEHDRSELNAMESDKKTSESEFERITAGLPEGETPESICTKAEMRVTAFIDTYKEKAKVSSEKAKAKKEHAKAEAVLESALKNDELARENHEKARSRVNALSNLRVSAILEAERKNLKPGVPCPVCGSLEHPAAGHPVTEESSAGKIPQIDDDLKTAQERENQALRISQEAGKKLSEARSDERAWLAKLEESMRRENECEEKILEARSAVCEVIEKIGIHNPKSCDEIKSRVKEWKSRADSLSKRITEMTQNIISRKAKIDENIKTHAENESALEAMKKELETREENFRITLASKNFGSEKQFTDSILKDEEMTQLQETAQSNDDEKKRLQAVREDRIKRLHEEEEKAVTPMKLEDAESLFTRKKEEFDHLSRKLAGLESAQESRKKLRAEYDKLDSKYKDQEELYNQWSAFNNELGEKKGGKFSKFAQKITLRMLVECANSQLVKMNSRYTLIGIPNDKDGLSLGVKDSEQAGEIRPTTNLSGGERFIISLALALGLSQISGSKAQVDSLFIDEGFGSLDEDALNSALEALGEIRRDGRMIGIISHISGISESIRTKINVIRKSEGTSIIIGPGCSGGL